MKKEWQLYSVFGIVWVNGSNMAEYVFIDLEQSYACCWKDWKL